VSGGAHLLGVVDGFLECGERFAVALACSVSPVREVAAISLQHLGSFQWAIGVVWPVVRPQGCCVQSNPASVRSEGVFSGVVSTALDTVSIDQARRMGFFKEGGFTAELSALPKATKFLIPATKNQSLSTVKVSTQWVLYRFLMTVSTRFGHHLRLTVRGFSTPGIAV
jgi:hypothetical protein